MPTDPVHEDRDRQHDGQQRRFGVRVAGVSLLLPQTALEHVQAASVFPLPGAAQGVLGLAQVRGQPVVVLDPAVADGQGRSPTPRQALLVIGAPPEAAALAVDAPPQPVRLGAQQAAAIPPAAGFAGVLDQAFADAEEPGVLWWSFEPRRLFEALAGR